MSWDSSVLQFELLLRIVTKTTDLNRNVRNQPTKRDQLAICKEVRYNSRQMAEKLLLGLGLDLDTLVCCWSSGWITGFINKMVKGLDMPRFYWNKILRIHINLNALCYNRTRNNSNFCYNHYPCLMSQKLYKHFWPQKSSIKVYQLWCGRDGNSHVQR